MHDFSVEESTKCLGFNFRESKNLLFGKAIKFTVSFEKISETLKNLKTQLENARKWQNLRWITENNEHTLICLYCMVRGGAASGR